MHPYYRTKHYLFIYSDVVFELDLSSRTVAFFLDQLLLCKYCYKANDESA